jgi:ABC-type nickel/cobalt efflux system permease component RcnA
LEEETMSLPTLNPAMLILLVGLVLVIGIALWMYFRKARTQKLRSKFGPEYDKTIAEHRDRGHAETELQKRAARVAKFHIQPLQPEDRSRYAEDWSREQSRFVDDPRSAVNHADTLVQDVMRRRGYPVGDFDQNAADLSVDHPLVVENYRMAHEIAVRDSQGVANTEDLRQAMVGYRALFEDLLVETAGVPEEVRK